MSRVEAERIAAELRVRMERRVASDRLDLAARARALARRHELPLPTRVEWSDRQQARWGSCDPADGYIRVSRRLAAFPVWVLDYVLVHELAHLAVPDHGPRFQALVARYPRAERAVGFLIAKDLAPDEDASDPSMAAAATTHGESNGSVGSNGSEPSDGVSALWSEPTT
jgi:hypothetical protein